MKVGEKRKLLRQTFLHQGVFVIQNSMVIISSIKKDNITVEWRDQEGQAHLLAGVTADELSEAE